MAFKSWLNKLVDPHSYSIPVVIAVLVHGLVIVLLAIEWPTEKRQVAEPKPRNIQAKVIQTENKQVLKRQQEAKKRAEQRRKDAWRKKQLAQKKAAEKKAAAKKAAQNAAAKKKAQQELLAKQKQQEQKRLAQEKTKKALAEKQAQEKLAQEKLAQQKRAEEKRAQELKEQQAFEQAQQAALLESLAQEEQQRSMEKTLAEEQQVQKNAAITDNIIGQIQEKIYQTWRYPPSARPNMTVMVSIQLVPTGEVINVSITKGSGIEAIDRSVLAAVKRASPLPVPNDNRLFEQKFRNFSMEFSPKDAVW